MNSVAPTLVLASSSPRRRQLLEPLGFRVVVVPPEVDEDPLEGEPAREMAPRLARQKALVVAARHRGEVVLAADTSVLLGEQVLGKPRDEQEARQMLEALSGREHEVLTGVFAVGPQLGAELAVSTRVRFRPLSAEEIAWYVASGEPMDKAGGYGIQGLAGAFVRSIEGSYSNVVGLPLAETLGLLAQVGLRLPWEEAR